MKHHVTRDQRVNIVRVVPVMLVPNYYAEIASSYMNTKDFKRYKIIGYCPYLKFKLIEKENSSFNFVKEVKRNPLAVICSNNAVRNKEYFNY